jgi:Amt family ammonium transporter
MRCCRKSGFLFAKGALDFAGGTVVHINAAVAGLVGAYFIGKRLGLRARGDQAAQPALTMIGASILWVGWFGFNAGSNAGSQRRRGHRLRQHLPRHRRGGAGLDAGGVDDQGQAVDARRSVGSRGRPRRDHAGGCGSVGLFGALAIGAIAGVLCLWGVTG